MKKTIVIALLLLFCSDAYAMVSFSEQEFHSRKLGAPRRQSKNKPIHTQRLNIISYLNDVDDRLCDRLLTDNVAAFISGSGHALRYEIYADLYLYIYGDTIETPIYGYGQFERKAASISSVVNIEDIPQIPEPIKRPIWQISDFNAGMILCGVGPFISLYRGIVLATKFGQIDSYGYDIDECSRRANDFGDGGNWIYISVQEPASGWRAVLNSGDTRPDAESDGDFTIVQDNLSHVKSHYDVDVLFVALDNLKLGYGEASILLGHLIFLR